MSRRTFHRKLHTYHLEGFWFILSAGNDPPIRSRPVVSLSEDHSVVSGGRDARGRLQLALIPEHGFGEAMDSAQVARNLSKGKGYTTLFIRPFSIHLVKARNEAKHGTPLPGGSTDDARLKEMHPDLANPPVYPCVLAGLMKVLPFKYAVDRTHPFWSVPAIRPTPENPRQFWRYEPDFLIGLFNQILFFAVIVLTFFLTRRLFDSIVAWTSACCCWVASCSGDSACPGCPPCCCC
jgi:hypothetical protein